MTTLESILSAGPKKYKYGAMNKNGRCFVYAEKPTHSHAGWFGPQGTDFTEVTFLVEDQSDKANWDTSLVVKEGHNPKQSFPIRPFTRILAREGDVHYWVNAFFGYIDKNAKDRIFVTTGGSLFSQVMLFDGNEELLGTTDNTTHDIIYTKEIVEKQNYNTMT